MIASEVQKVKNKLVNIALTGILILIIPALIGSISRYSYTGLMPLHFIQFGSALGLTILFIFRKKFSFELKGHSIVVFGLLSGFGAVYSFGLAGATDLFAGGVILSALFFNKKTGLWYLFISGFVFFSLGLLYVFNMISPVTGNIEYFRHFSSWMARGTGIILVLYVVILSIGKFNELFIKAIAEVVEKGNKLKSANDALSDILQFLPVPIGVSNEQGDITFINNAFENNFGYTITDIPTLSSWYEKAYTDTSVREENSKRWKNDIEQSADNKHKEPIGQYQINCKNGDQKHVLLYSKRLDDKVIVAFVDITEQYNAEETLRSQKEQLLDQNQQYLALNEELKERNKHIQNINEELIDAKDKAQESDRLKSAFLANMSHEIRTPMNGIVGFAGLLMDPNITPEKQTFFIDIINKSCHRLLQIVNDVLDISKIETGQIEVYYSDTNLNQLFNELMLFYQPQIQANNIELIVNCSLPYEDVWVKADKTKLYQILTILMNNAIKFTNEGTIKLEYKKSRGGFLFEIKDSGIGIESSKQEFIFQRFYKGAEHSKYEYGGTGLGLSIAKAFVDVMGGVIKVDSELGKGSCFYFDLPFTSLSANKVELEEKPILPIIEGLKTILVVEDEELYFQFLNSILCSSNIKVFHAENGQQAIDLIKENPTINLVLMDIRLPDINGFEATRAIKSINKAIPVVAFSGYDGADYREKTIATGFSDYLTKPMNKKELLEIVKKYLG
jgi:PAS domain S-box-containing protein